MQFRISMVTLGVTDLAKSRKFYEETLGLPLGPKFEGIVFFSLPGSWLALYPRDKLAEDAGVDPRGTGFSGQTLACNVNSPEEVDGCLARAADGGAAILSPAKTRDWGGYSGYFADPDGHLWEVAFNPHFSV